MARRKKSDVTFPLNPRGEGVGEGAIIEPRIRDEDTEGEEESEKIIPEGWDSQEEFLAYWLKEYTLDYDYDKHNRDEAMEDLRFLYVDQWDEETRAEREREGRPCITINTLPQFIGQVIGDRRMNRTSIKLIPSNSDKKQEAELRAGIIKGIEYMSNADRVYDMCCEDQVGCGISNFQIVLEEAKNDVFQQDIFIRPLDNPFAVTWDRRSRDPTGRDARHCFVEETISKDEYEAEYGGPLPTGVPTGVEEVDWQSWVNDDEVKIVALWIMVEKPAKFALMADGQVEDVTDLDEAEYAYRLHMEQQPDGTIKTYIREGVRTYAQRWLITGFTILEGPYELPLSRLPVIKVSGRVGRVGLKQYRFGLIRWARDPSLMRNYWRSIAVETLAMAPKAVWIADVASVKGREDDFRAAHLTGDPLLVYNTGKNKPERVDPPNLPTAVLQEVQMNTQDIKDVTGLHDASLGIRSNEVSGKAITARQREGDVATITYHDNLNASIQEAGSVINELIPITYDTTRTVITIGADDEVRHVRINDPLDEASPNITEGRYITKVTTGPSFTTQREESSNLMLEMTKTMPELMSQAADITAETLDLPGSDRLAKRFKKLIPAAQEEEAEREAQEAEQRGEPPQPSPEQQAAEQLAAMQAQLAEMQVQLQIAEMEAKVAQEQAKARKAELDAEMAEALRDKAREDARAARANADRAEALAEQADDDVVFNEHKRRTEISNLREKPKTENRSRRTKKRKETDR